jgi:hypothetical protein
MNTLCTVLFSYSRDSGLVTSTAARALDLGCAVTVADDARDPMPGDVCVALRSAGCRVVTTDFNRKGNLNGTECAVGMLDTFRNEAAAHGADTIIKLDPDMWLGSLRWLPRAGEPGAVFSFKGVIMGAYAMRADVIPALRRGVLENKWSCRVAEAFAIGTNLVRQGAVVHPTQNHLAEWTPELDVASHDIVLMARWPHWAREEGMRRLTAAHRREALR